MSDHTQEADDDDSSPVDFVVATVRDIENAVVLTGLPTGVPEWKFQASFDEAHLNLSRPKDTTRDAFVYTLAFEASGSKILYCELERFDEDRLRRDAGVAHRAPSSRTEEYLMDRVEEALEQDRTKLAGEVIEAVFGFMNQGVLHTFTWRSNRYAELSKRLGRLRASINR